MFVGLRRQVTILVVCRAPMRRWRCGSSLCVSDPRPLVRVRVRYSPRDDDVYCESLVASGWDDEEDEEVGTRGGRRSGEEIFWADARGGYVRYDDAYQSHTIATSRQVREEK